MTQILFRLILKFFEAAKCTNTETTITSVSISDIIWMVGSHDSLTPIGIAHVQQTNGRFYLLVLFLFNLLLIALLTVNYVSKFLSDQSNRLLSGLDPSCCLCALFPGSSWIGSIASLDPSWRWLSYGITCLFSSPRVLFDPNSPRLSGFTYYITVSLT